MKNMDEMQMDKQADLQRFSAGAESAVPGDGGETCHTPGETGEESVAGTPGSSRPSFEELLKNHPEYKAAYDARVKRAVEGRFRQMKALETRQEQMTPLLTALAKRYGLSWQVGEDISPLQQALAADTPRLSREERKNALRDQVAAIRSRDPRFHLGREMADPLFRDLSARGVPLFAAYALAHQRENAAKTMGYAIRRTRQAIADQMGAGVHRPIENGLDSLQTVTGAPDPRTMSARERKEMRERVAKGEKVYW